VSTSEKKPAASPIIHEWSSRNGLAGAFGLTRLMDSLLFGVSPLDPVTFLLMPALLPGIAILASYLPARRALRVDPMVALREE
jgi:putative ABC transport system permease protein